MERLFRCWNCGADNRDEEDFCSICGFQLARVKSLLDNQRTLEALLRLYQGMIRGLRKRVAVIKENARQQLPVWGSYCDGCGAPVVKYAEYCFQCGFHVYPVRCPNRMCLVPNPPDQAFCDQCGWGLVPA